MVVQYDKDLLEVWDEAKRLRCEWFNDYEKTASKPPMVIADLDVIQLDFRGMLLAMKVNKNRRKPRKKYVVLIILIASYFFIFVLYSNQ